jgi:TPR repeat protein
MDFQKTIEMYRNNALRSSNPLIQLEFARFLIEAVVPQFPDEAKQYQSEAFKVTKKAAHSGHMDAQFLLAECYETGVLTEKGKSDYTKAFQNYLLAAKQSHPEANYRVAVYHENGRGTTKSAPRALLSYQKAASLAHPGAMYRLGMAGRGSLLTYVFLTSTRTLTFYFLDFAILFS